MNIATFLIALALCNVPVIAILYAAIVLSGRISQAEEKQEQQRNA